jgi:hypothetical protein
MNRWRRATAGALPALAILGGAWTAAAAEGGPDLGVLGPVVRDAASACPLYVADAAVAATDRSVALRAVVANAGPGEARGVRLRLVLRGRDDAELASFPASQVAPSLEAGAAAVAEVIVPAGDWNRPRADAAYARTEVEVAHVRCDRRDPGPADAAGETRAAYRRRALEAREERWQLAAELDALDAERRRLADLPARPSPR